MVIAIDGPAGAGKSTVARALAERLGATYLDSGAMYRSVALLTVRAGADPDDPAAVVPLAEGLDIGMAGRTITIGAEDVSAAIRTPEVTAAASRVSVHRGVREAMVQRQRELLSDGAWVAEGRDITTVVAPDADVRLLLSADPEVRMARRKLDHGGQIDDAALRDQILRRDADDSTLVDFTTAADGVVHLDGSFMTLEQTIDAVVGLAERALARKEAADE